MDPQSDSQKYYNGLKYQHTNERSIVTCSEEGSDGVLSGMLLSHREEKRKHALALLFPDS